MRVLPSALAALALTGCSASPPSAIEARVATAVKHQLTVRGSGTTSPVSDTPANVARGQRDFGRYCYVCHGLDGQATGVPFAAATSPPIPSLASHEVQSYSDGQLHWIVENGLRPSGMPGSREILNDEERWRIVLYLRHLPPAGSLGEPRAFTEGEASSALR